MMRPTAIRNYALLAACAVIAASLGLATSTAAAAPSVVWQIRQRVDPTILPPVGANPGRYKVRVINVGGAAAPAGTVITDTMSTGVTPIEVTGGEALPGWSTYGKAAKLCSIVGQEVECKITETIPPGEEIEVTVPMVVAASPPATATSQATVSSPGGASASESLSTPVGDESPAFGFVDSPFGLSGSAFDEAGETPAAGAHPFDVQLSAHEPSVETDGYLAPVDHLHGLRLELPRGLVADPQAVSKRCTLVEIQESVAEEPVQACPAASQVGVVHFSVIGGLEHLTDPLIDMVPPPGVPAELAFVIEGTIVHVRGGLSGGFRLTAGSEELTAKYPITGVAVELWGVPSDPRHDHARQGEGVELKCEEEHGCKIEPSLAPFLTMPTSCGEPLALAANMTGWLGGEAHAGTSFTDLAGNPVVPSGCGQLAFEPSIEAQATTGQGDSPSGLDFAIHQPQDESLEGRSTAALKNATVTLPEGMVVNPSVASGLSSCSEGEMGYAPEEGKIRFKTTPQDCPDAAKIGTLEVHTPLLEKPLPGSIFVAKPYDNPFGSLLAIYLAIEDEETGIVAKLAGKVTPDPVTGRLTATFTENPELPLEDIDLRFFNGSGSVLTTPLVCGQSMVDSVLTPWSSPEGADAHPSSSFQITSGCYASEGAAPKTVSFSAGTVTPVANAYSPFVLGISRPDGSQRVTGLETTLPEGLLGSVAGVSYCSEAGIAQARSREEPEKGRSEQQDPSCPASSELGAVNVTAGSGEHPFPVSGHAYLAGPYKNAPLSIVVIVPALAGPFDLGTVVDRVALFINEQTARIHAVADPLPTIRDGIPLDLRNIELDVSRAGFMFNPTSCEPTTIEGQLSTQAGQSIPVSDRFQVGGCQNLSFKPLMSITTQGKTSKANGASLTVKLSQKPGEAHIHKVDLTLPTILPARLTTLQQACTEAQFAANPAGCPPGSFIGTAKAVTPILSVPLTGPAILVSHGGAAFPDVEFLLQANERGSDIRITLDGKTDIKKGITYSRFETVPDAPITSFETSLPQGPHSVLSANGNLCTSKLSIPTSLTGQNGAQVNQNTPVTVTGCPKAKVLTRAQKLALALKACHKKPKGKKRQACERAARKQYGPLKKAKKAKKK